jgi:hypothetical protein
VEDLTIKTELQKYNITDAAIANMAKKYMPLRIDGIEDKEGLSVVRDARIVVKKHRVAVEKTRKQLKEDSLRYGRAVDNEAKRIVSLLSPIESRLAKEEEKIAAEIAAMKQAEIDRVKAIEEALARREEEARQAEIARQREVIECERRRLDVIAAEQKRVDAELKAERERFEFDKLKKVESDRIVAMASAIKAPVVSPVTENQDVMDKHVLMAFASALVDVKAGSVVGEASAKVKSKAVSLVKDAICLLEDFYNE